MQALKRRHLNSSGGGPARRGIRWEIGGILALQALLLAWAGWHFRHALNPDGVAYLRLAQYYAEGRTDLMVSGYWGPMLSWLMAPFLKAGCPPLVTARAIMGLSALWLTGCAICCFRSFRLSAEQIRLGTLIVALAGILWSVENITPDLLVAGWLLLAVAWLTRPDWPDSSRTALVAGLFGGFAYLAKAVALPFILLTVPLWAITRKQAEGRPWKPVIRAVCLTWIGCALPALPWSAVLSMEYGRPTVSTSAPIVHAVAGPGEKERYPLGRTLGPPEPGRLTDWEDPSLRPDQFWSPFASWQNLGHQLRVIAQNLVTVNFLLTSLHLLWPAVPIALLVCVCRPPVRRSLIEQRWWWAILPVATLSLLYLPSYLPITEQRYFYAAVPWLFVLSVGLFNASAWQSPNRLPLLSHSLSHLLSKWKPWILIAVFLLPVGARWIVLPSPRESAWTYAHQLAEKLRENQLTGPIAGSGMLPRGRTGLYLAFRLGQPWHGDQLNPTPRDFKRSGARLFVVRRESRIAHELSDDPQIRDLDRELFASPDEAADFPLQVFDYPRGQSSLASPTVAGADPVPAQPPPDSTRFERDGAKFALATSKSRCDSKERGARLAQW